MRRERSFLILVVLGIALGAYIYFVERKRPAADQPEEKPKVFENVQAAKIEEIVVSTGTDKTRLKKTGQKWQIVEPVVSDADEGEINNLTSNLAEVTREEVVDEAPASVKPFGLDPPRSDVAFRLQGSGAARHLLIGSKAPTGAGTYAKLPGDKRVFLISGFLDAVFVRTTFDLRDKTILKFERDKIDALEIVTADHTVKLAHAPSEWHLTEPLQVRADFSVPENLIGRLGTAQMKSLVSAHATDPAALKPFGLDHPAITATVVSGSARAALLVGSPGPDGSYYAKDASRPLVFAVESTLVDDLKKPPADYRRKDIFEFRPFNATRVEITRNGQTAVFDRVKNTDPKAPTTQKWRQTAPASRDVDLQKMDAVLSGFSNLRAESWLDKPAAPSPSGMAIAFVVKYDDGKKEERLSFVKAGGDVHVSRADEPGAAKIATTDYDAAVRALDDVLK